MQFVDKIDENDEMLVIDDIKVFIDKKASFLIGTKMDYVKGELESGLNSLILMKKVDVVVVNLFIFNINET